MTQAITRWTPGSGVTMHNGETVPHNSIFFVAPPPQIGEIYTAHSGWQGDKKAGQGLGSIALIALAAFIGMLVGAIVSGLASNASPPIFITGAILGGLGLGYATFRSEAKKNAVTYTGTQGIARYRFDNDSVKREQGDLFLFANAVELRTAQTRHYTNGIYSGTDYNFTWTGSDGKPTYRLQGRYSSEKGWPKPGDPFHYARAAEIAWSRYLLQFVNAELERSGAFRFNLRGNNCVVAGQGFLDLYMNGEQIRCPVNEIAKVDVHQGTFILRRKDAKDGFLGIGSKGIFRFQYAELANGLVFRMLLDRLVGIGQGPK